MWGPLWELSGSPVVHIPDGQTIFSGFAASARLDSTQKGTGVVLPGNDGNTLAHIQTATGTVPDMSTTDKLTFLVFFRGADTSNNGSDFTSRVFHWTDDGNNDGINININKSGNLFAATFGNNTNGNSSIVVDDNEFHVGLIEWDQGNEIRQWVDGIKDYDISYTETSSTSNSFVALGRPDNESGTSSDLEVLFWVVWNELIVSEPKVFNDPFAMLRPAGF